MRRPFSNRFTSRAQLLGKIRAHRARALAFHLGNDSGMELEALERREPQLPPRRGAIYHIRFWRKMNDGFPSDAIPAAIMKHNGIVPHNREIILSELFPCYSANLKHVHEIGFISQFNVQFK